MSQFQALFVIVMEDQSCILEQMSMISEYLRDINEV